MKSMPCSFVLALLCVLLKGLMHSTFYSYQASSEDAIDFLQKQNNETYLGTVEQAEQQNYLQKLMSCVPQGQKAAER
eukprot:1138642-Pelagomonas_calceolata.AAC.1